jgi:hypothetical protein
MVGRKALFRARERVFDLRLVFGADDRGGHPF